MAIQCNQSWDAEGNLVYEEWVEVPDSQPDPRAEILAKLGLSEEELQILLGGA